MAEVALFHHALGLTPGVLAFAAELRAAGHTVHTPDLFDGRVFGSIDAGMGYAEKIGFPAAILERGTKAVEGVPAGLTYIGFSLGVLPAQKLAQTRPGARGAVLCYACVPVSAIPATSTTSPTARCRPTTRRRPRCSPRGCSASWAANPAGRAGLPGRERTRPRTGRPPRFAAPGS